MELKIKVCGMKFKDNLLQIAAYKPDYLGFIFYEKSKRFVGEDLDADVVNALDSSIKRVGVFVNHSNAYIEDKIKKYGFELVQLHGDESVEQCKELKSKGIKIVKVFQADEQFDFSVINPYKPYVDYFLFDTKSETYGGTGKKFDWSIFKRYDNELPIFLSGGVDIESVEEIKKLNYLNIHALDINSKFELEPAKKDTGKVKLFIDSIKMKYSVNEKGFYGNFGGAYIPEMLYPNVEELAAKYLEIMYEESFQKEFRALLKDYVGRPTPLYFAKRLSEKYKTNIYLKREDLCHTGAHKINNTIGQILLAKRLGKTRIIAETGAGQHGVATATVCALMGYQCVVYMGEVDIERQKPNVERMKMLGAEVRPAKSGSRTLKDATNEAIRDWINNPVDTHYIIGSVVGPHPYPDMVARFQSVISEEIKIQLKEKTGKENPDYVIACVGGGSNAAGAFYHFLEVESVTLVAVEAAGLGINSGYSAATTVLGKPGIIHGSKTILMQTEDGQIVEPHSISAGLDYPGIGPIHAHLFESGRGKFYSITDKESFLAAVMLSRTEGIIPALESAHAIAVLEYLNFKSTDNVVINLSGRGDKDMQTYINKKAEFMPE